MCLGLLIGDAASTTIMATENTPRLWADVSHQGDIWQIQPQLAAPPGLEYRYRINALKEGPSGRAQTAQSGAIRVDESGQGALAQLSLSIPPGEHCDITIQIEGNAAPEPLTLHLPSANRQP